MLKNNFKISQQWTNADSNFSGAPESWMEYAKYYVKETSNEYYNLVLDRIYRAKEDGNLWLSFPSSDRDKIKKDDFIILKKAIDVSSQVEDENKFKVIDIKNEAPESIAFEFNNFARSFLNQFIISL